MAGDFGTLLAAVDAAGLTATPQSGGPFTVFAPTDAAFAALPEGTVEALLGDIPALTDILLCHVVDGAVAAADPASPQSGATMRVGATSTVATEAPEELADELEAPLGAEPDGVVTSP